jgi:2-keto-4-pentenoate hydratase/2-oxohepta-3-ene-1,7-dioic acid hydratase in catechol pathway
MRIARIDHHGTPTTAIVRESGFGVLPADVDVLDVLTASPAERDRIAAGAVAEVPSSQARLLAPIRPATLRDFSAFEQHIEGAVMVGGGRDAAIPPDWYTGPACYFSNPHAITGPDDDIAVPPDCEALDLELEVAVVIGAAGRDLSVEQAASRIVGYTIWNDWSARDLGAREARLPFGFCKAKDFANTLGPWIVTPDELERHRRDDRLDLRMEASINGTALGTDTLANLAWSLEELVAFAARGAWIAPGDVIGSGTCGSGCLMELWGRNQSQEPPPLVPGDTVTLTVEGIGTLTNTVSARRVELPPLPPARPGRLLHRAAGVPAASSA